MCIRDSVNNPREFINQSCNLVNNNGLMFIATINKTLFSLVFAKFTAEYILGFLPKGTHNWNKFLTPEEIYSFLIQNKFDVIGSAGVNYNPLGDTWYKSQNMNANYMVAGKKI